MTEMDNLIDTVLNVIVFVFIGVLIWLYRKPVAGEDGSRKEDAGDDHH